MHIFHLYRYVYPITLNYNDAYLNRKLNEQQSRLCLATQTDKRGACWVYIGMLACSPDYVARLCIYT